MGRIDKINYHLDIAETVLERSTCRRSRYGAIIVQNDEIVSTGYNGAPRGRENCTDMYFCLLDKLNIPHGQHYELCRSVHAEMNAIISSSRKECIGSTIFLVGRNATTGDYLDCVEPCAMCRRVIINAGIRRVIMRISKSTYATINVQEWVIHDDSFFIEEY